MNRGTILHACISKSKGTAKDAVPRAILREDHGLEGDAHAGPWHRQVSLLSATDIEGMRAKGLDLEPGAFGENLVVGGLDLDAIGIGTLLRAGEAELEVTQIGKVCHSPCRIYHRVGDCIMPRAGLFARVLKGGEVAPGASIEVISEVPRGVVQAAVLTVSDRCAAGAAEDTAAPAVADLLRRQIGAHIAWTGVVSDDTDTISTTVKEIADRNIDLLVTVGGTGCGPRAVTPEATRAVVTRELPGLAEAMRVISSHKTPHALLQRGLCGICGSTLIANVPGSRQAAVENLTVALLALPHAMRLLRGDTAHPDVESRDSTGTRSSAYRGVRPDVT